MDWIFEHIWVLLAIAGVVAKIMQARGQKSASDTGRQTPDKPKEYEFEDPALAERTRKIREEIQRKIEERRGQHMRPAVPQPASEPPRLAPGQRSPEATPPVLTLPEVIREVLQPAPPPVSHSRLEELQAAEEAERQAALEEQLREAELMRAAAQRRVAFEAATADKEPGDRLETRTAVLDDLRDPLALRRAFILREVLGPPVALR
jgi:hypothetical protein